MTRYSIILTVLAVAALAGSAQADLLVVVDGGFDAGIAGGASAMTTIKDPETGLGWFGDGVTGTDPNYGDSYGDITGGAGGTAAAIQAMDDTNASGPMTLSFDVWMANNTAAGGDEPDPNMNVVLRGETHPWNYMNSTAGTAGGGVDILNVWLELNEAEGGWHTYSLDFDLGPDGFDHAQEGGSAGGNVIYLALIGNGTYPWQGDFVLVDNVVITPEPASLGLLALGGLAAIIRRRR